MSEGKKRRQAVSFKDVQIAYLMNGVGAVKDLFSEGKVSPTTVRRALRELSEAGRNVSPLQRWVDEAMTARARGRTAPEAGSERSYRVQKVGGGAPFLRLPVTVLGVGQRDEVTVRFDKDRIVVTRNPS
jgi:hypothetical protein